MLVHCVVQGSIRAGVAAEKNDVSGFCFIINHITLPQENVMLVMSTARNTHLSVTVDLSIIHLI